MQKILTFSFAICLSIQLFGQNSYPTCDDLVIEAIQIDSSGNLSITNRNTCYDCRYGLHGCLYSEMLVIRTVFPFDTIAATDCYCLFWEDPNLKGELQNFSLNMYAANLPPISEIQVRMRGCGCEVIPISKILTDNSIQSPENLFSLFPNPASDNVYLSDIQIGSSIRISDMNGKILHQSIAKNSDKTEIRTADFSNGIYIVSIENNGIQNLRRLLISK